MKQHKIAHILPWSSLGGTEYATLRIAETLEGGRFTSVLFCPGTNTPVKKMFASAGFETVSYEAVEPSYRHPRPFLRASFKLARDMKRAGISLVHCSDLLAGHYAALAGRLLLLPVVCHIRCCHEGLSIRDRSFLKVINRFVFVSHHTWKHFGYKVSKRRGAVIYDGLDVSADKPDSEVKKSVKQEFGIPAGAEIIGMAARVAPAKDFPTLARAAARIVAVSPNVRFLIMGNCSAGECGRHYQEVKQALAAHGVEPYFVFTDFRSDVARIISAMDVFVLSTHTEGLPLVIMEAMAHAKPVVATAVGGIPEIVVDGQTGLLHSHGDDEMLASKILSVLRDKAFAAKLGDTGRRFVKANLSKRRLADNLTALYCRMLGERNKGSGLDASRNGGHRDAT
jgi:glycosyltransferase involved in cell wall biosynthesis